MIGVFIKKGNFDTTRDIYREDDVKRHREKMAIYKHLQVKEGSLEQIFPS